MIPTLAISNWAFSMEEDFQAYRVRTCSLCPWLWLEVGELRVQVREDGTC